MNSELLALCCFAQPHHSFGTEHTIWALGSMHICMQYQPEPLRLRFKTITCSKLWCFTVHTKFSALIKTYMHSQYVAINIFGLYWVRMFEKFTLIYCVLGVCRDICVEARGQLTGFHFLLLPCRSRGSNSGHQDCWHLAEHWNYKIAWRTRHDGMLQKSEHFGGRGREKWHKFKSSLVNIKCQVKQGYTERHCLKEQNQNKWIKVNRCLSCWLEFIFKNCLMNLFRIRIGFPIISKLSLCIFLPINITFVSSRIFGIDDHKSKYWWTIILLYQILGQDLIHCIKINSILPY